MSATYKSRTKEVNFIVDRAAGLAVRNMLEATHTAAKPKTPKEYGDLKDNVIKSVQGTTGTIVWMQDYAIYQENKRHDNYTTPGTGPHFAENAVREVSRNSNKYFHDAFKSVPKTSSQQGGV